jgi:hypothetical protein
MDEELLKKLAGAFGVDPKNLPQGTLENISKLLPQGAAGNASTLEASSKSSAITPDTREKVNNAILESLNPSGSQANRRPIRWPSGAVTYERVGKEGGADYSGSYTDEELKEKGGFKIGTDWSKTDDPLRGNRLDAYKASQKDPQARAEQRKAELDGVRLPISDNITKGLTGRDVFKDRDGKIEDPKQLKERMLKEGSDMDTATRAAGQRYRDMFEAPNAKSNNGAPNAQRNAVMGTVKGLREDGTSPRMDVMAALKTARSDNLKAITEQRMADPNRKPVGTEMAITSGETGRVLMKRGEGEARVARGGLGTQDVLGKMELTPAGENAIRDRLTVQETSAPTDKPLSGSRVITGRYGTAIGGTRVLDKLKNDGAVPKNFNTTSVTEKATVDAIARPPLQNAGELTTREVTRTVGQAPLPEKYAEGRDKILADAGQTAKRDGAVVGDAKPLMDRVSAGTVNNIDKRADRVAADLKQSKEDKLGSDFLNAYNSSGGKVGTPKPDAESPGPRTKEEKAEMQAFVNKEKKRRSGGSVF